MKISKNMILIAVITLVLLSLTGGGIWYLTRPNTYKIQSKTDYDQGVELNHFGKLKTDDISTSLTLKKCKEECDKDKKCKGFGYSTRKNKDGVLKPYCALKENLVKKVDWDGDFYIKE